MTEADVQAVSSLIDAFGDALHGQDVEASMAQLDPHADLVVIPSEGVDVFRGPAEVRAFLSRIYAGPRRYGWQLGDRVISAEGPAAWFTALGDETVDDSDGVRRIAYCLTGAAVKTPSGWKLRLLHASEDPTRTAPAKTWPTRGMP